FFMEWHPADTWTWVQAFLAGIAATLQAQPRAIGVISGHRLESDFRVTANARPPLIYDYYGFPPHTFELTYPTPGEPALAQRVQQLLADAGVANGSDAARGLDHGVFIPLKVMFPAAEIPVVQL